MDRYEEALERARAGKPMDEVFPELKESEDEKNWNAVLEYVKDDALRVWLEKQKERKPVQLDLHDTFGYEEGRQTGRNEGVKLVLNNPEKYGLQKEQKPSAVEVLNSAGLKTYRDGNQWCILVGDNIQEGICGFGDTISEALYEFLNDWTQQKSAEWSEEDKEMIDYAYGLCYNAHETAHSAQDANKATKCMSWLKSLRPQSKQEWSEEDKRMLLSIINAFRNGTVSTIGQEQWLKSLRPQPHWKPSEEQMKAMEEVRTIFHNHHLWDEINPILYDYEELMRDLKKLM